MSKLLWKALLVAPAALGAAVAVSGAALAVESAPVNSVDGLQAVSVKQEPLQLAQITSVSELTDVKPSDWAFQALQGLVQNYGCIQGYPDRTFRGDRSLTRYEFAAGLNSCLDVMAVLISQTAINPDDLAAIRRLQEEFQAELATLRGRVDSLEAKTATLEAQQFSTTTKLAGQVDANLVVPFDKLGTTETSTSVATRARLNFNTSLTGSDLLRIRLQGSQGNALNALGGLAYAGSPDSTYSNVSVNQLFYKFPVGKSINVTLSAQGLSGNDWVTSTILPYDGPAVADASGAQFYDSIGSSTPAGAGAGVNIGITKGLTLDVGYTAGYPGAASPAVGIFSAANQSYIAQLTYLPGGVFSGALTYLHNDQLGATNTYGGSVSFNFGKFFVAGHGAYSDFTGGNDFSWTAGAGIKDVVLEGSQLGIYGGQLPRPIGDNPLLVEGYYQIPFSKYLTITPAVIYGDTKTGGSDTSGVWGVVKASFNF
ncbi:MAG: iron uptake porin [Nodosilinea sp.]